MTVVRVRADRWAAGGEAIGRDDNGRVVFVGGAIPGELVDAEISEERRDWARGRVHTVLEPVAERVVPACQARRSGCGGCGWMHVGVDAQVLGKQAVVADALARIGRRADVAVGFAGGVPARGYRTTMRVCGDPDGRAGLRGQQTHDIVAIPDCHVAHPALRALLADLHVAPGQEVIVRYSVAEQRLGLSWDGSPDAVSGFPADAAVGRRAHLCEDIAGRSLRVSIGSFFQSGPAAAELLVAGVRRMLPELDTAKTLVDAYAGVGLFAACAGPTVPRVFAIETGRTAVADAAANLGAADGHGASRDVTVVRGEVGGWRPPPGTKVDVVIADPARSGLGKPGTSALSRLGAPVLGLVSCDPASLGRDVKLLAAKGYVLTSCDVVDVFPETTHVETVSRFERRIGPLA